MALEKSKTLSNGVVGNYWKITSFYVYKMQMSIHYIIELFKDSSFSSINPIGVSKGFTFPITHQQLASDLTAQGYTKIKDYANTVRIPEVAYQAAVPATYDANGNVLTPEIPEVAYRAAVYCDADLQGAIDV